MNRAGMLRIAAFGIIGLGAALLLAALLLSTYTAGKIKKIPLNIDVSLVSDGIGTALDPASLSGERFIIDKNVPLVSQQQITVESPANADVVTLQAGTTVRRSDKQQDNGLLLAMVDDIRQQRDRIVRELPKLGYTPHDSQTNFVLFGGVDDPNATFRALLDHGIIIRDVGIPNHLRVTAGTSNETTAFLGALGKITPC